MANEGDAELFTRFSKLQGSSSKPTTLSSLSEEAQLDELWFRLNKLKGTTSPPVSGDPSVRAFHLEKPSKKTEFEECEDLLHSIHEELRLDNIDTSYKKEDSDLQEQPNTETSTSIDIQLEARLKNLKAAGDKTQPDAIRARLDQVQGKKDSDIFLPNVKQLSEEEQIQQLIQQATEESKAAATTIQKRRKHKQSSSSYEISSSFDSSCISSSFSDMSSDSSDSF